MTQAQEKAIEVLSKCKEGGWGIYFTAEQFYNAVDIAIEAINKADKMEYISETLVAENDELIERLKEATS